MHVDNMNIMIAVKEEVKPTIDMIAKIQDVQQKFTSTEGLFLDLQVKPRGKAQYKAMEQRLYGMTQTEKVLTETKSHNDASVNVSNEREVEKMRKEDNKRPKYRTAQTLMDT